MGLCVRRAGSMLLSALLAPSASKSSLVSGKTRAFPGGSDGRMTPEAETGQPRRSSSSSSRDTSNLHAHINTTARARHVCAAPHWTCQLDALHCAHHDSRTLPLFLTVSHSAPITAREMTSQPRDSPPPPPYWPSLRILCTTRSRNSRRSRYIANKLLGSNVSTLRSSNCCTR